MTVPGPSAVRPRRSRFRLTAPEQTTGRGRLTEVEIFGFDDTGDPDAPENDDQNDQILRIRGDRAARQAIVRGTFWDSYWGRLSDGDTDTLYFLGGVSSLTKDLAVALTDLVTAPVDGRIRLLLALDWETQPSEPGAPAVPTSTGHHVRTLRSAQASPADQAASFEALSAGLCAAVDKVPALQMGWRGSVAAMPADGTEAAHWTSRLAGRVATQLGKKVIQPVVWRSDQVAFADRLGESCLVIADRIPAGADLTALADAMLTGDTQHIYVLAGVIDDGAQSSALS